MDSGLRPRNLEFIEGVGMGVRGERGGRSLGTEPQLIIVGFVRRRQLDVAFHLIMEKRDGERALSHQTKTERATG